MMLKNRWLKSCKQVGLEGDAMWQELSDAYGDPARAYHNLNHIADCLNQLDEQVHLAVDPVAVEFAIWFHDIVYDPRSAENEEHSAVLAGDFLATTSSGAAVADLIRATRHDGKAGTRDEALIRDIDLGIFGRIPTEYDAYARAIREEYRWVPLPDFIRGRTRVLESFLGRPSIYLTEEREEIHGERARANLAREIRELAAMAADGSVIGT